MLASVKRIADIATALEAAAVLLAKPSISWAMCKFGLVVPGAGTLHYAANAGGAAALMQAARTFALTHPVIFLVPPASSAWFAYTLRFKSKL
jgi:hypothetical protein